MKAILAMFTLLSTVIVNSAMAASSLEERSQTLVASYTCEGNKVLLTMDDEVINIGLPKTVTRTAVGENLNLIVGDSEYLLWPRLNGENRKALTIFKKTQEGLRIENEIEMGGRTPGSLTVPMTIQRYTGQGPQESITLKCDVTLSFIN